ncbi:MAG TPA: TraB/GumN family protein, partial [Saprospiraceae bacterium]|nr:TraB/GumN family protein [Saprospiraceae bacterium]
LPFALSNMIDSGLLSAQQNMPLDEYLWQYAKQAGKTMYGIETLEDQLGVLGSIDLAHQAHGLLQLARNLPGHRKQLNRLADLYVQGNVSQLYRASRKSLGKYRKTMLFDRNHKMALRFDEIAKTTTLLAAVGAAHLWGGYGLIRLLKAKGWKCKPVIR